MAITKADIKLMASQELTDDESGGGAMTGNEIVDGNVNNLFADISRLDRTIGRVSLRKCFPAVQTANSDRYYGSHVILTDPPDDSGISVTMFSTDDYTDRRGAARNHMENYVIRSVLSRARLYENQLEGQGTVLLMQRVGLDIPEVGQVFSLIEDEDLPGEFEQFIKITNVDVVTQSFTDNTGDFDLDVITLSISDALRYTFHGGIPSRLDVTAQQNDAAVVRRTSVADVSKYYGVSPLAQPITNGDLTLMTDSIYANIVPSAQSEVALADLSPAGDSIRIVPAGSAPVVIDTWSPNVIYAGMGMERGAITLENIGSATVWQDDGAGNFNRISGTDTSDPTVTDYTTGEIATGSASTVHYNLTFTPAGAIADIADTDEIEITISNRATTYVKTLNPAPTPGSLNIDYMALGKWYRLRDQGDGSARGDGNYGVASINYATGTVTITLAALPDVDSSLLFTWGGAQHYAIRDGNPLINLPGLSHTVADGAILPNSLTITYESGSTPYTLTDNGVGILSGTGGDGVVDYVTGNIYFQPSSTPDALTDIIYDFDTGAIVTETLTPTAVAGGISVTLASSSIQPGSVSVNWATTHTEQTISSYNSATWGIMRSYVIFTKDGPNTIIGKTALDDGLGAFEGETGTINYGTGALTMTVEGGITSDGYQPWPSSRIWVESTQNDSFTDGSDVIVKYIETGVGATTRQELTPAPGLEIALTPRSTQRIVAGSMRFTIGSTVYIDRAGSLVRDVDASNNAGTLAGTIDYDSGVAIVTDWPIGTNTIAVQSLLVQYGDWSMYDVMFRTAGAPLQPASFYIQGNRIIDSALISDAADTNGDLSTVDITGHINIENGIARVKFGRFVVAAGNEGEVWYDPLELDGNGNVWQPEPVDPNTLRYNAVAYSYIPIDAGLIGVDPVRLPSDGRVPIFRSGDVCVIHSTTSEAMPGGLVADQVINLTGGPWSLVELYDQNNVQVDPTLYTVDLTANTVTMGNPLDLGAYTQPLVAMERIEDMKLVSDVQINGQISVSSPITHDYPALTTYVSSALVFGDMGSRYLNFFSQQTWLSNWLDAIEGSNTTAQYNEVTYPLIILNDGAIEERWALIFTSASEFNIVGETVGVIGTGTTLGAPGTFIAPTNPQAGQPYWSLETDGFGGGWATGNVIRFNTESANAPVWVARTTLPGPEEEPTDEFILQIRGDAD
ncbi:MAG: hypothetical protein KZQ94_10460 [Candidatus Thiodiazotropha sp. (ex Troendleina suluensis)]|nr:hypothetical protein [Candidatus Thiodiazotropha sp. (ex Troendleina suluensis)]